MARFVLLVMAVLLAALQVLGDTTYSTGGTSSGTSSQTSSATGTSGTSDVSTTRHSDITSSTYSATTGVAICDSSYFCAGPVPVGNKSNTCACPATYLNIDACCLSQNWIIGLACGAGGILLIITLILIAYISAVKSKLKSFTRLSDISSTSSDKSSLMNAERNHVELVDKTGIDNQAAIESAAIAVAVSTAVEEVAISNAGPSTAPTEPGYDDSVINPSAIQHPNTNSVYDDVVHVNVANPNGAARPITGVYDDVVPPAFAADSGSTFKPRLDVVDTATNYSIRRPTAI